MSERNVMVAAADLKKRGVDILHLTLNEFCCGLFRLLYNEVKESFCPEYKYYIYIYDTMGLKNI